MKLILVSYGAGLESNITDLLSRRGVKNYTKWTGVQGRGVSGGPHLGDHMWPTLNNVLAIVVADDKVEAVLSGVRTMRDNLGSEGVKAFVLNVEQVT
jgi:nitrogen regulatory protein PII